MTSSAEPALLVALTTRAPGEGREVLADFAVELERAAPGAPTFLVRDEVAPTAAAAISAEIAERAPRLVVLSVAASDVAEVERVLGRPFDLQFAAADPETPDRLRAAVADFGEWTKIGLWGGTAGTLEMTVGAALHALRVPLRGAALCSAQAATLTLASARLHPPGRVAWVAFVAAGLKAFSPGGGRVRPMVAITAQGAWFGLAVQLLGWNAFAVTLGGAAIGTWAALQGFLVQYLLLGDDLAGAYGKVVAWLEQSWSVHAPSLPVLLGGWAALHATLAASAALAAWKLRALPRPLRALAPAAVAPTDRAPAAPRSWPRRFARELGRWHFWVPLVIVGLVLLATGRGWESVAWLVVRFLAVAVVLVALLSLFQPAALARRLRRHGWWGPAAALSEAFARRGGR